MCIRDSLNGAAQHAAQLGKVFGSEDKKHDGKYEDQLGESHAEYFHGGSFRTVLLTGARVFLRAGRLSLVPDSIAAINL